MPLATFDLEDGAVQPEKDFIFENSSWPRSVLPVFNRGCGNYVGLDCITGHVLTIGLWEKGQYALTYTDFFVGRTI